MASFTREDMDWVWGSLKPWQILHSTLAERERNGNAPLDHVWERVSETLGAEYTATRRSIDHSTTADQQTAAQNKGWSHGIRFLADDGEFWRHGGVLESRVREWLTRRDEEDQQLQQEPSSHHALIPISNYSAHHHQHHHIVHPNYSSAVVHYCSSTGQQLDAIASCSSSVRLLQPYHNTANTSEEVITVGEPDQNHHDVAENQSRRLHQQQRREQLISDAEEEEEISAGFSELEDEDGSSTEAEEEEVEEHNAPFIGYDYEENEDHHGMRGEEKYTLVLNRCCRASAAADQGDHDHHLVGVAAGAKLAEAEMGADQPEMEVCAVCLEQLNDGEEELDDQMSMMSVQALACRHVFHRACIEPWLERQPHARCPCCRAPISPAILARSPLNLAGGLHLASSSPTACAGHHRSHAAAYQHDIMGLLADMEAALEHLGFRS